MKEYIWETCRNFNLLHFFSGTPILKLEPKLIHMNISACWNVCYIKESSGNIFQESTCIQSLMACMLSISPCSALIAIYFEVSVSSPWEKQKTNAFFHFLWFHMYSSEWVNEVTENVCGNPTFYVQGDKSLFVFIVAFLFSFVRSFVQKWQIEKCTEMWKMV